MNQLELRKYVTEELISKAKYAEHEGNDMFYCDPTSKLFNCWGLVWWLFLLEDPQVILPRDPYKAQLMFEQVKYPDYRDIVSCDNYPSRWQIHLGFVENPIKVIQCSETTFGVTRVPIEVFGPRASYYRLKKCE